jgi:hypothetical protein
MSCPDTKLSRADFQQPVKSARDDKNKGLDAALKACPERSRRAPLYPNKASTRLSASCEGVLQPVVRKNAVLSERGAIMSFRNGDKSREHRLRKAREKKRESVRKLSSKSDTKAGSPAGAVKK